jgi:hypothetical protein
VPKYRAPQLINPKNGQGYGGGPLRWEDLHLESDEYYSVTVYYKHNRTDKWDGRNTAEPQLFYTPDLPADDDRYEWSVRVMRRTGGTDSSSWQGVQISPYSDTWIFTLPR